LAFAIGQINRISEEERLEAEQEQTALENERIAQEASDQFEQRRENLAIESCEAAVEGISIVNESIGDEQPKQEVFASALVYMIDANRIYRDVSPPYTGTSELESTLRKLSMSLEMQLESAILTATAEYYSAMTNTLDKCRDLGVVAK